MQQNSVLPFSSNTVGNSERCLWMLSIIYAAAIARNIIPTTNPPNAAYKYALGFSTLFLFAK